MSTRNIVCLFFFFFFIDWFLVEFELVNGFTVFVDLKLGTKRIEENCGYYISPFGSTIGTILDNIKV